MKKLFLKLISILFCIHNLAAEKIQPTYKNIFYGPHQDMTLNFWKFESDKPVPLLVHIHGGGWLGGKKSETISLNELKKGYSFASIDYRLAGTSSCRQLFTMLPVPFNFGPLLRWNFNPAALPWLVVPPVRLQVSGLPIMTIWPIQNRWSSVGVPEFASSCHGWANNSIHFFLKKRLVLRAFGMGWSETVELKSVEDPNVRSIKHYPLNALPLPMFPKTIPFFSTMESHQYLS